MCMFWQVFPADAFERVIHVEDDVSDWRAGDKLILTSTDYQWQQAETLTVVRTEGKQIFIESHINDFIKFTHFGEIWEDIDMRAEIGLLSR